MSAATLHDECATALRHPNVQAFLRVIRQGETSQEPEAYRWIVGSTRKAPQLVDTFADHPRRRVFIPSLRVWSTAAGAYQFLQGTWDECARALGLPDFSPASQDLAAVFLIRRRGALPALLAGDIEGAIAKCAAEWASLPGSPYGQPVQTLLGALSVYRHWRGPETAAPERPRSEKSEAPAPTPSPPPEKTPTAPAPQPTEDDLQSGRVFTAPAATPNPPPESPPMVPLLIQGLASVLIDKMAPLATEKLARELGRHTDNPEVAQQISAAIIDTAKAVTGKRDAVAAVAAAQADPQAMAAIEQSALDQLEKLAPVLDRLAELDRQQWERDEKSRQAADDRARAAAAAGVQDQDPLLTRAAIAMMVGVMLGLGVLAAVLAYFKVDVGSIIGTLLTLAGVVSMTYRTRYEHRYGSSSGSAAKDAVIGELSRRK